MTTKLKSKSNVALLIVCVAALLAVGARWVVWPLLRHPLLYGYMLPFESILWNAAYALVYTTPLLALLGHACFRGVSYKADYVLPFVYVLLAVRPLVGLAAELEWLLKVGLETLRYAFGISNLFDLLEIACLVLFGFSALLVAVLCLCKVRNRVAVLPVVLSGAVYLLINGVKTLVSVIEMFFYDNFAFFFPRIIANCGNFLLLLLAEVLLFTALLIAGTGRKRPKVVAAPVEDAAQPEPIIETTPEVAVEEPIEEPETVVEAESVAPSAAVAASFSVADEIAKFKALMDQGVITAEEFEQKKKQLLNS